jgi:hypothetical protein
MHRTLALILALSAPTLASAQDYDVEGMQAGLSMLELNVDRVLDANGFEDVDPTTLDLRMIVEIVAVVRDDENAGSQRQAIEAALDRRLP